jgi:hypothetical protein
VCFLGGSVDSLRHADFHLLDFGFHGLVDDSSECGIDTGGDSSADCVVDGNRNGIVDSSSDSCVDSISDGLLHAYYNQQMYVLSGTAVLHDSEDDRLIVFVVDM